MIDAHCHLEQDVYDKDRNSFVPILGEKMKAIITVCATDKDWAKTKEILRKHKGFIFATAGEHPQNIDKVSDKQVDEFIKLLRKEAKEGNLVGIGEVGLDYHWIKDTALREKQKESQQQKREEDN